MARAKLSSWQHLDARDATTAYRLAAETTSTTGFSVTPGLRARPNREREHLAYPIWERRRAGTPALRGSHPLPGA